MKNLQWKVLLVLALAAISIYGILPLQKKIKLGLDLKGGIHLVAEVKVDEALAGYTDRFIGTLKSELAKKEVPFTDVIRQTNTSFLVQGVPVAKQDNLKKIVDNYGEWDLSISGDRALGSLRQAVINSKSEQAVDQAVRIIRERVNTFGVTEPVVQRQGLSGGRIIIQLPGVEDTDRVKSLIEGTARLELKLVIAGPASTREGLLAATGGVEPAGAEVVPHSGLRQDGSSFTEYFLVQKQAIVSGDDLRSANRESDQYGRPAVGFTLTSAAGQTFGEFTESHIGKGLAIVLDGKVQSSPTIEARITTNGIITGQFTIEEANDLAVMLQSGALPAGLRFLEQRVVGPSLGLDSIKKGTHRMCDAELASLCSSCWSITSSAV